PWLGDLPYVGALFRYRTQVKSKRELLVILTPHVVCSKADGDRVLAEESKRIDWILGDVIKYHGTSGLEPAFPAPNATPRRPPRPPAPCCPGSPRGWVCGVFGGPQALRSAPPRPSRGGWTQMGAGCSRRRRLRRRRPCCRPQRRLCPPGLRERQAPPPSGY